MWPYSYVVLLRKCTHPWHSMAMTFKGHLCATGITVRWLPMPNKYKKPIGSKENNVANTPAYNFRIVYDCFYHPFVVLMGIVYSWVYHFKTKWLEINTSKPFLRAMNMNLSYIDIQPREKGCLTHPQQKYKSFQVVISGPFRLLVSTHLENLRATWGISLQFWMKKRNSYNYWPAVKLPFTSWLT